MSAKYLEQGAACREAVSVASWPDLARWERPRQGGVSVTQNSEGDTNVRGHEASESFPVSLLMLSGRARYACGKRVWDAQLLGTSEHIQVQVCKGKSGLLTF